MRGRGAAALPAAAPPTLSPELRAFLQTWEPVADGPRRGNLWDIEEASELLGMGAGHVGSVAVQHVQPGGAASAGAGPQACEVER